MSGEKIKDACPKCAHYAHCETPCILAHMEISRGPEVNLLKEQHFPHKNITVVWSKNRELRFSDMPILEGQEDIGYDPPDPGPDAWPTVDVSKKQTGVFIDRFFNQMSFADLAAKWEIGSAAEAKVVYAQGKERVLEIIRRADKDPHRVLIRSQKRSGRFSRKLKAFLLAKCFDLSVTEVGQVLGINARLAARDIRACADQIRAGKQIVFFEGEDLKARGATPIEIRNQKPTQA